MSNESETTRDQDHWNGEPTETAEPAQGTIDGFAEHTAWVQGGDALLARDLNGNGLIDSQGELFGTATAGFAALKALDSNNDNLINVTDATFGSLRDHCRQ